MKLLLDTNILLWFVSDNALLSSCQKKRIENIENEVLVSIASLWEITIKLNIGKLRMAVDLETFMAIVSREYGFKILQISENHLFQYLKLPLIHRDPFDRLIYAQAIADHLEFVFTDEFFKQYDQIL